MTKRQAARQLIIIGGGASGIILLTKICGVDLDLEITLIDPSEALGLGRAYSTPQPHHLLNVLAEKMSVDKNDKLDFFRFVQPRENYVPRFLFGEYLREKLAKIPAARYRHIRERASVLERKSGHWTVKTERGTCFSADFVVIATGYEKLAPAHVLKSANNSVLANVIQPYDFERLANIDPSDTVLIVGTGLTSVDVFLELKSRGARDIHFLSRRGLVPLPHATSAAPSLTSHFRLPLLAGYSPLQILQVFRLILRQDPSLLSAITLDLRHQASRIWSCWSRDERRKFIRHLKPYWEITRHRIPRTVDEQLAKSRERGESKFHSGRILSTNKENDGLVVKFQPRRSPQVQEISCRWIVMAVDAPIDQKLELSGARNSLQLSPLGLGYENHGAPGLWLLGPPAKGGMWETTAIPEICSQADDILENLKRLVLQEGAIDLNPFCVHAEEGGESYQTHLSVATRYARSFAGISLKLFVHAVFPFWFENDASEYVRNAGPKVSRRRLKHFSVSKIRK